MKRLQTPEEGVLRPLLFQAFGQRMDTKTENKKSQQHPCRRQGSFNTPSSTTEDK
jgi:hypothetical protein